MEKILKEEAKKILQDRIGTKAVYEGSFCEIDKDLIDSISDEDICEEMIEKGCSDIEPSQKILKITDKEGHKLLVVTAVYKDFEWKSI